MDSIKRGGRPFRKKKKDDTPRSPNTESPARVRDGSGEMERKKREKKCTRKASRHLTCSWGRTVCFDPAANRKGTGRVGKNHWKRGEEKANFWEKKCAMSRRKEGGGEKAHKNWALSDTTEKKLTRGVRTPHTAKKRKKGGV